MRGIVASGAQPDSMDVYSPSGTIAAMRADPNHHLIIAFASCSGPGWAQTMKSLPPGSLKNLEKLLRGMKALPLEAGKAQSLSMPHERVLARELGLQPDSAGAAHGLIPWAAMQARQSMADRQAEQTTSDADSKAWAFVTPCHWAMGREHATLTDPAALGLSPAESQTLLAAMQPYFAGDGITLHYAAPDTWLAEGELFRGVPTASLERVLGRNVDAWLPPTQSPQTKTLRRLQNEMQMLLYTHPLNDARSARRQPTVNSIWLSGTGALARNSPTPQPAAGPKLARHLAAAVMADDWAAYAQAWQALDAGPVADLLAVQSGMVKTPEKSLKQAVKLTLCSETSAQSFVTAPPGLKSRISSLLSPLRPFHTLEQLSKS